MAWACLRTSPSAEPGPRAAAGPRRPRRRQAGAIAAVLIGGWIVRWWRLWLSVGCRWLGKGDAVRTVLGLGLRGSRTPADPGSSKSEPEMTTWASSRSRSTNSRRRASIWACKARRSSETACSLLVSSLKRDANSSRASECGSGKATTRLILLFSYAARITASSTGRRTPRPRAVARGLSAASTNHGSCPRTVEAEVTLLLRTDQRQSGSRSSVPLRRRKWRSQTRSRSRNHCTTMGVESSRTGG
jgi:hypothetical protein